MPKALNMLSFRGVLRESRRDIGLKVRYQINTLPTRADSFPLLCCAVLKEQKQTLAGRAGHTQSSEVAVSGPVTRWPESKLKALSCTQHSQPSGGGQHGGTTQSAARSGSVWAMVSRSFRILLPGAHERT